MRLSNLSGRPLTCGACGELGRLLVDYEPIIDEDPYFESKPPVAWRCKVCSHVQQFRPYRRNAAPKRALVVFSPSEYTFRGSIMLLSALQDQVYNGYADPGVVYRITGGQHCQVIQDGKKQRLEEVQWTRKA